jgi:hypothetical protein
MAQLLRHAHIDNKGGKKPFAALSMNDSNAGAKQPFETDTTRYEINGRATLS